MMRGLYRLLLHLHPYEFRQEFAGEMLWIFDEARSTVGVLPMFADAVESLGRQWLIRSGVWTYVVGVAVNATLLSVALLIPQMFGGAPPKPAEPPVEASRQFPMHYRLYMYVEPPAWDASKPAVPREP
jgi:hypothetical protein